MSLKITPFSFEKIEDLLEIDLFIIGLGREQRASYLAHKLRNTNAKSKFCIELLESQNSVEKDRISSLGFQFIKRTAIYDILGSNWETLVVDYSVMMKSLYCEMIFFILEMKNRSSKNIYFSYTHAKFEEKAYVSHYIESIKPALLTDNTITDDTNKTKIIVSLGYERLSAIGIIENLEIDYDDVIVLIHKTHNNKEHYKQCLTINKEFLELLDPSQVVTLDFFNFDQLNAIMESILYHLNKNNFKVILAPLSIKTFSLFAMVKSLEYDNVIFYNVTSVNNKSSYLKEPNSEIHPLIYRIN